MLSAPEGVAAPPARRPASAGHAEPRAPGGAPGPWWERGRVVLPVVWLAAAALIGVYLRRGWVPHDEGTLAQALRARRPVD